MNLPDLKVNLLSRTERYRYTYLSAMHDKNHSRQSQLNWMMNDIVSLFTTNFNVNLILDHTQFLEKWLQCDNPCYNVEYIKQIVKTAVPTATARFLNFFVGQSTLVVDEILRLMGDDFLTCNINEWKPVMSTVAGFLRLLVQGGAFFNPDMIIYATLLSRSIGYFLVVALLHRKAVKCNFESYVVDYHQPACNLCKSHSWKGNNNIQIDNFIPTQSEIESWIELLQLDTDQLLDIMETELNQVTGTFELEEESYEGVVQYIEDKSPLACDIYREVKLKLSLLAYWDTSVLSFLLILALHSHHPPDGTALIYTSKTIMDEMIKNDDFFDDEEGNKTFDRVIATIHKDNHHAVMEILIPSKQVLVYDGGTDVLNALIELSGDVKSLCHKKQNKWTADYWHDYATDLLHWLNIRTKGSTPAIKDINSPQSFRVVNKWASKQVPWLLGPAYLFPLPGGTSWQKVIHQFDGFSCGPIAALHVLMLCGFPLREHLFLGDFKKDYLCCELLGTLANGRTILEILIGSWLTEAVPSGQVTKRLKGEYCIALGVTKYIFVFDINVKKQLQEDETYEEPMMSMCITSTESFTDPKIGV